MWARIDKLTNERDDLKEEVIELTAKVERQSEVIKKQGEHIEDLTTKIDVLISKFGIEDADEI